MAAPAFGCLTRVVPEPPPAPWVWEKEMLSLAGCEPSSPGAGWAAEKAAGASWQRKASEVHEGFGAGADGKPARGKTFWRGLRLWLEVLSEGRRKAVASALEWWRGLTPASS